MAEYFSEPYPARADGGVAALPRGAARRDRLRAGAVSDRTRATQRTSAEPPSCAPGHDAARRRARRSPKSSRARLTTVQDLLFLPAAALRGPHARRADRRAARTASARSIEGEVQLTEVVFRRRRAAAVPASPTARASLTLRFFHFSGAQQEGLARGTRLRCFGEVRRGPRRPRDRASGISARRRRRRRARRNADADLSAHRRRAAGPPARS